VTPFSVVLALSFAAGPIIASEDVVLATGFRIHADRHEQQGTVMRLYIGSSVTEIPTQLIESFEPVEDFPHPVSAVTVAPGSAIPGMASPVLAVSPRVLLHDAAARSGLPPSFVESVAKVESGFRSDAVSPKGALGIMQLMPGTAKRLSADPLDPAQNVDAGARLLRELLIKYDGDVVKALSAYNAGEDAVARYHGMPPYPETQNYVNQVVRNYISAGGK
jgi:soluble lytic murein transglycosylase-like protein